MDVHDDMQLTHDSLHGTAKRTIYIYRVNLATPQTTITTRKKEKKKVFVQ